MATTRERLERRWTPGRIVLLVLAVVATLLLVAAGLALWWLPPVLAETPRERFEAPTRVTVQDAGGSAGVEVSAGWVALGVGPFLPEDAATLVSPDGVYRVTLGLAPLPDTSSASVEAVQSTLLAAHPAGVPTSASAAAPASAASTTAAATAPAATVAPASPAPTATATDPLPTRWSEETLTSGVTVRYIDVVSGDSTTTLVVLLPSPVGGAPGPALALSLVATTPTTDAPRYRTVTADLAASAAFAVAAPASTPPPTPSSAPPVASSSAPPAASLPSPPAGATP